ncbi:hypothetical protein M422DRAFT_53777 [Sphaerobolus stellatus SS14]|uniref:Uncharacterized protein n=1 Tax=Sphaerobolus stellatus (strain SS14) TaxID=990650 RepID=A0A0C9TKR5_SPHS4|nr:hypothetical protein M422DRAFT_53777 [Sphaerobolus stellatus SS14]
MSAHTGGHVMGFWEALAAKNAMEASMRPKHYPNKIHRSHAPPAHRRHNNKPHALSDPKLRDSFKEFLKTHKAETKDSGEFSDISDYIPTLNAALFSLVNVFPKTDTSGSGSKAPVNNGASSSQPPQHPASPIGTTFQPSNFLNIPISPGSSSIDTNSSDKQPQPGTQNSEDVSMAGPSGSTN